MEQENRVYDKIASELRKQGNIFGHAMASTLRLKPGLIEHHSLIHFPKQTDGFPPPVAVALVNIGNRLGGPSGRVHNGIISFLFDDIMSFASAPLLDRSVTKDLVVCYAQDHPPNTYLQFRVYRDEKATLEYKKRSGSSRKKRVFLKATCSSLGTSTIDTAPFRKDDGTIFSTATITMVQVDAKRIKVIHDDEKKKSSTGSSHPSPTLKSRL